MWPDKLPKPEYRDLYTGRAAKHGTGVAAMASYVEQPDDLEEHWKILESLHGLDDYGWR